MKVDSVVGIVVGLLAILVGFTAYEVCGSWVLSSLVFLITAGLGLCLVDAVSRKLVSRRDEGDAE